MQSKLITCEKCHQTKPACFYKRLSDFSGYWTICRECTGDKLAQQVCVTCGLSKSKKLGFSMLFKHNRVLSTECRACREAKYKKAEEPKPEPAKPREVPGWPWKPYSENKDVPP